MTEVGFEQDSWPHNAFLVKTQDTRGSQMVKCLHGTQRQGWGAEVTEAPPNPGSEQLRLPEVLGALGARLSGALLWSDTGNDVPGGSLGQDQDRGVSTGAKF